MRASVKSRALALTACTILSGCLDNTARQMLPLAPTATIGSVTGNPIFETADKWSFSRAVIQYPARNGSHTIQAGDYLLFGVAEALRNSRVRDLRLTTFENKSRMGFGIVGRHLMTLDVEVAYTIDGRARLARYTMEETDVGTAYAGDSSPIPLILNQKTDDTVFHTQLRPILDRAIEALVEQIGDRAT